MTTIEFLSHLRSKDIRVWPEGDTLRYDAPPGALTPDLRQELLERKQEILIFLRTDQVDTSYGGPPILPVHAGEVATLLCPAAVVVPASAGSG